MSFTRAPDLKLIDNIEVPDAELLTPKELQQERQAIAEERSKLRWLTDSPRSIASRVPVSVFALGDLIG